MSRRAVALTTCFAISIVPYRASACGGFFCSSSPIDQAGEAIVYGLEDDGTLTMSVRIDYSGDDDDFAWILPVVAPPEIAIGTDALFDELRRVTEPTFVIDEDREGTCRSHPSCVYESSCLPAYDSSGCGSFGGASDPWTGGFVDAGAFAGDAAAAPRVDSGPLDPGVMVFSQGPIGPYETAVLGAATAAEVVGWLVEHGYDVPPSSTALLEPYAAAGHVFVALRLQSNTTTRSIRPVVLRMPTREACLPLRLTAVATVPRLPITAFFLGNAPVVPANFSTVELTPEGPELWTGEASYRDVVEASVDDAGGQAFAREYSGPTPAISLARGSVDDLAATADPALYLRELGRRGYSGEVLLLELFERYLRPPAGYAGTDADYYNCLFGGTTAACGEPSSFDAVALTAEITRAITLPRQEAHALVHRHHHLTRLYTSIRARDMTIDPVFVVDEGVEDRDNVFVARRVTACSLDYYAEQAPMHWEIGEARREISAGVPASDRAYCSARGAVLASEATECAPRRRRSGCSCGVRGASSMQGTLLSAVALLLVVRRLRRRS